MRRLLVLIAAMFPLVASAALIEEVVDVPVSVRTIYGSVVNQSIKVTIFRDDQRRKSPYLILNHGRPGNAAGFAAMKRQRYLPASEYFVSKGFVVMVPTRVGYGDSGGPDVEYAGKCDNRDYPSSYAAAAEQSLATLRFAATLSYIDTTRGIVVGQSYGGATAIALASMKIPGLVAAVNFAGGGGTGSGQTGNPCSRNALTTLFRDYGKTTSVPTLWLYSANDQYFGPDLPKEWFSGFVKAGGKGRFVELPAYKDGGHYSFTANPEAWKPALEELLREIGF